MLHIINPRRFAVAALAAFCALLFFPSLGDRELTSSHEARAAQNAQMILDEGDWLIPRLFDGHLELQKPPLYYWLVALLTWLKGGPVDAWTVRLPAALSALACVLFLYYLGVRIGRPLAGLLAAFILASCLHFTWLARVGRIDMPLTLTITLALGAFRIGNLDECTGKKRLLWHAFGYTAIGLGLLLKGPIAAVLPAVVCAAVWLVRERRWPARTTLWWGIPLMLVLAAPWYVWANARTNGRLWEVFFWYHNVERGLGGSETLKAHPFWFYLPQAWFDMLPWSFTVPIVAYVFLRNPEIRQDDVAWTGLLWFVAILAFLSCMSFKRADYLLPAYPGMAIFLGVTMERWWQAKGAAAYDSNRVAQEHTIRIVCHKTLIAIFGTILALYLIGWQSYNAWFLPPADRAWPYRAIAQEIRVRTQGPVIFFRAESHVLMFHVGKPVDTIVEWENLDWWVHRPRPVYFVMPAACADEWRQHLTTDSLEEVLRTTDYVHSKRERALVVLRSPGTIQ